MSSKAGILGSIFIFFIKCYKKILSPIIHLVPNSGCRFYPTCSTYTIESIKKHGAFKGGLQGFCRILRCNPFCEGGIDNPPEVFKYKNLFKRNEK